MMGYNRDTGGLGIIYSSVIVGGVLGPTGLRDPSNIKSEQNCIRLLQGELVNEGYN
jgi:hypothetical protein